MRVSCVQLLLPGLVVLLYEPFHLTALVAIALTVLVTLLGIKYTPTGWWDATQETFDTCYKVCATDAAARCASASCAGGTRCW